jgi:hypothetical protein
MQKITQTEIDFIQSTIQADLAQYNAENGRHVTIALVSDVAGIGMTTLAYHLAQNGTRPPTK